MSRTDVPTHILEILAMVRPPTALRPLAVGLLGVLAFLSFQQNGWAQG